MAKFACIGSRDADEQMIRNCQALGGWIARCGGEVHSGNANGVDQAFANGANVVRPEAVYLHLPWDSYNREAIVRGNHICDGLDVRIATAMARPHHDKWDTLTRGVLALHRRNVAIVMPRVDDFVNLCIAAPSMKKVWGGGTAMGMNIATAAGVEVVNINNWSREMLDQLCKRIRTICVQ